MIYLLRHGLDDERYIGGYSDVSLTEEGKKQIKRARDFIIENNLPIEKIYSSDVVRAMQTANIIREKIQKQLIYDQNLRELDKGTLTGMDKNKAYKLYPEYKNVNDITKRYPAGESMQDLYNRVISYIENFNDDNCLLITHRGFINMIYYNFTNTPLTMDKEKFDVTHGSIHELDIKKKIIKKIF